MYLIIFWEFIHYIENFATVASYSIFLGRVLCFVIQDIRHWLWLNNKLYFDVLFGWEKRHRVDENKNNEWKSDSNKVEINSVEKKYKRWAKIGEKLYNKSYHFRINLL